MQQHLTVPARIDVRVLETLSAWMASHATGIAGRFAHDSGTVKAVARLIGRHIENILTYLRIPITNAASELVNSKIQWVKYQARGFLNEARFMRSILFHCGGLDLCPTHTSS